MRECSICYQPLQGEDECICKPAETAKFVPGETTLRDGTPARIYAVEKYAIHGAVWDRQEKLWKVFTWKPDGTRGFDFAENNLTPNAEPETREVWIVWDREYGIRMVPSKPKGRMSFEKAIKKVTLTEGEFDDE